jgi:excisionase family DNA binding protein
MSQGHIEFFTVTEVAKLLKLDTTTVYKAIKRGAIKATKIGGSVRVSSKEIERLAQGEPAQ